MCGTQGSSTTCMPVWVMGWRFEEEGACEGGKALGGGLLFGCSFCHVCQLSAQQKCHGCVPIKDMSDLLGLIVCTPRWRHRLLASQQHLSNILWEVGDSWTWGARVISQPPWKVGMALGVRAGRLLRPVEDKGGGALPSALSDGASMGELVCQFGVSATPHQ